MIKCLHTIMLLSAVTIGWVSAQTLGRAWNFDSNQEGSIPTDFSSAVGNWKIVTDSTAPSGPNVLAQVASNAGSTFNLIWVSGATCKLVDISVKMRAVAGREDQGGGLVWRGKDSGNYYVARYNPLEDNYRVYKVVKGHRIQLQSADIKRSDGWHVLRVTMDGDHIQCYYDGQKYLDVKDSTFQEAGQIGVWTKADAQSHFDDLTLTVK